MAWFRRTPKTALYQKLPDFQNMETLEELQADLGLPKETVVLGISNYKKIQRKLKKHFKKLNK